MEKSKVHLIIDYTRIENDNFSKWISYIEQYLTYGLSQKGIEISRLSSVLDSSNSSTLIYLPVLTNQSIEDKIFLNKVREISTSGENTLFLALIKDYEVVNKIGSNSDLSFIKMFIVDQDTGKEIGEKDLFNKDNIHLFLFKIYDLCSEIERYFSGEQNMNLYSKGTVYLAEPSLDQVEVKEEIKRELIQQGYNVIPTKPFKGNTNEIEEAVFNGLSKSNLSVHIFGKLWNEPIENIAGIEMENRLASEFYLNKIEKRISKQKFSRIIWLPDNITIKDERQQKLLNKIQREKKLYAGSEIISSTVEELKDIILEKLKKQSEDNNSGSSNINNVSNSKISNKNVYIVINDKNSADSKVIDNVTRYYGYNPFFANNKADERQSIRDCNSVLYIYQNDNITWLKSRMNELNKIKTWEYSSTFEKSGIISMNNQELPEDEIFKRIIHIKGNKNLELETFAPFFL